MRRAVVISISLTILLLITTILPSTEGCASPEPENVFLELLSLMPASAGEDGCFFLIDKEIHIKGRVLTAKIYMDDEGFNWWWRPYLVEM